MAVRSTMAELIARTRQLIGDVATPTDFTDQDVQDACDAHREDIRYELLRQAPDIQPPQGAGLTATFIWVGYFSQFQHWEAGEVLQGIQTTTGKPWMLLTPVTAERIVGRWTFEVELPAIASTVGQYPPVYISGRVYDLYRVAADLLQRRIALRSFTTFDVTVAGQTLHLNQILDRWEKLRMSYLAQSWNRSIELVRDDLAPDLGKGLDHLLPGALSPNTSRAQGGG